MHVRRRHVYEMPNKIYYDFFCGTLRIKSKCRILRGAESSRVMAKSNDSNPLQLYSLSSINHTQGHKNFSFCEQTLHEGLIDASCNWLQSTHKNTVQNNFWENYELKSNFRGCYFHPYARSYSQIFKIVCTSSKFNTFHAHPVSFWGENRKW
jgi:hypothetical protein